MIKKMLDLGVSYLEKDIDGLSPLDMAYKNSKQGGVHVQIYKVLSWYKDRDERGLSHQKLRLEDISLNSSH